MSKHLFSYVTLTIVYCLLLVSCGVRKSEEKQAQVAGTVQLEGDVTEEVVIPYKASRTLLTDLIHTKLEVSFDWQKAWMFGKATITAKPHFFTSDSLLLDAQGMEIKSVQLNAKNLSYSYANGMLRIQLDKSYTRDEKYTVEIEYIAKPNERKEEGGVAIKSNKGLFFINPTG